MICAYFGICHSYTPTVEQVVKVVIGI